MLRVAIKQVDNVVLCKVLEQPESFRSKKGDTTLIWTASDGFKIASGVEPQLFEDRLYVWGEDRSCDRDVAARGCKDIASAARLRVQLLKAVSEFNKDVRYQEES